jgi:phage terminase small subunit
MARGKSEGNAKGQEYKMSVREQKFVLFYLEHGDATKAVVDAKFNTNAPKQYGKKLLAKPKIQREIAKQWELFQNERIAGSQEIMGFYTAVMRGQVKDQFGLEATLADRLKATDSLAKRQIDAQTLAQKGIDNQVTIKLCWDRDNTVQEPDIPVIDDDYIDDIPEEGEDGNE